MKGLFRVMAVLLGGMFLGGTGAFAAEVGVTDKTIKVGFLTPLTGPAAGLGRMIGDGAKIAFNAVNDEGGVHGRKFELILEDSAYNPKETVAGFKKLVQRDGVFGIPGIIGTPPIMAAFPLAEETRVPTLVYQGPKASFIPPKRYVFVIGMPYQLEVIGLMEYAMRHLDAKKKKIGILAQDDLADTAAEGMRDVEKQYGLKVLSQQTFKRGSPDMSPPVIALMKDGVEMVMAVTNARDMALILKKSMELNFKPIYLGITPAADQSIFDALPPGELEFYAAASTAPLSMDIPGIKKMVELGKKYFTPFKPISYHLIGYLPSKVFIEGVKATGPELTREKLIAAFERFNNVDMDGLTPPVTFGPQRRYSASSIMVIKMDTASKTFKIVRKAEELQLNPFK